MPEQDQGYAVIPAIAKAITLRLREEIVDDIPPKPTIAELEKMMEDAEKSGLDMPKMLPDGSLCVSHKKSVFASDLADAAMQAIRDAGFQVVPRKEDNRSDVNGAQVPNS
jgi:hypothetical protein